MLRESAFAILVATVLASSSSWAAQGLTSAQARAVAKFQNVSVLVAVADRPELAVPKDICSEIEGISDWGFRKQFEEQASLALSTRFTVVPKTYDGDALGRTTGMGQIPRNALPSGEDVDAFIVFWGKIIFLHPGPTTELGSLGFLIASLTSKDDPEVLFAVFNVDIIDAKTQRTIARKELPLRGNPGQRRMPVRLGGKDRAQADWVCGKPLTEELKQELKGDYATMIKGALDDGLPILRLTRDTGQQQAR